MRRYSDFFVTLHDEQGPVGFLGRGLHYSILRAIIWERGQPAFHDFGIVWDEDHDTRAVLVAERLFRRTLLPSVMFLGEAKGHVSVHVTSSPDEQFRAALDEVCEDVDGDHFTNEVVLVADSITFLRGVAERWRLGTKPAPAGASSARRFEPAMTVTPLGGGAITRARALPPATYSVARLVRHLTQLDHAIHDERAPGAEVVGLLSDVIDARTMASSAEQFVEIVDSHLSELLEIYEQPSE